MQIWKFSLSLQEYIKCLPFHTNHIRRKRRQTRPTIGVNSSENINNIIKIKYEK